MVFSALVDPVNQMKEEPRWRQWLTPLVMALVVLAMSGALWRAATRPALVIAHPALLGGSASRPDAPAAAAEPKEADQPFSLDDLARGLLALSEKPAARELGTEVAALLDQRRGLEQSRIRRESLATAMGQTAALTSARLDRRQLRALATRTWPAAPRPGRAWKTLLEALESRGAP